MQSFHFKMLVSKNILKSRKQEYSLTSIWIKSYLLSLADLREQIKIKINKLNIIKYVLKIYFLPKDFIDILYWIILFYISDSSFCIYATRLPLFSFLHFTLFILFVWERDKHILTLHQAIKLGTTSSAPSVEKANVL